MSKIFWNVDTQYDFMRNDGKLYVPKAEQIDWNLSRLTEFARIEGIKVVNTGDWHDENSGEISGNPDFVKTFPAHCMRNTDGAKFIPLTRPKRPYEIDWKNESFDPRKVRTRRNIVLYKDKFDVFSGTPHAEPVLKLLNPKSAIVYGVATNVCVDCAVRGLLERNVKVYVPLDAIKELPGLPLPYDNWKKAGARLISTEDVLGGRW